MVISVQSLESLLSVQQTVEQSPAGPRWAGGEATRPVGRRISDTGTIALIEKLGRISQPSVIGMTTSRSSPEFNLTGNERNRSFENADTVIRFADDSDSYSQNTSRNSGAFGDMCLPMAVQEQPFDGGVSRANGNSLGHTVSENMMYGELIPTFPSPASPALYPRSHAVLPAPPPAVTLQPQLDGTSQSGRLRPTVAARPFDNLSPINYRKIGQPSIASCKATQTSAFPSVRLAQLAGSLQNNVFKNSNTNLPKVNSVHRSSVIEHEAISIQRASASTTVPSVRTTYVASFEESIMCNRPMEDDNGDSESSFEADLPVMQSNYAKMLLYSRRQENARSSPVLLQQRKSGASSLTFLESPSRPNEGASDTVPRTPSSHSISTSTESRSRGKSSSASPSLSRRSLPLPKFVLSSLRFLRRTSSAKEFRASGSQHEEVEAPVEPSHVAVPAGEGGAAPLKKVAQRRDGAVSLPKILLTQHLEQKLEAEQPLGVSEEALAPKGLFVREDSWATIYEELDGNLPSLMRHRTSAAAGANAPGTRTKNAPPTEAGGATTSLTSKASPKFGRVHSLDLPLLTRRKSSQTPMRRQLSRRVPRRDARRSSRGSRRASMRPSLVQPPFLVQSSLDQTQTSPSLDHDHQLDGTLSGDTAEVTEDLVQSPPPSTPRERNPLRRVSRMLSSAGPALVRRVSRLRRPSAANPELESLEATPPRYRPISIDQLSKATRFSKQELQFMYRGFKQECPSGVISEETFKRIYGKLFPVGNTVDDGSGRNTAMYAHYVFGTMDHDGSGQITFGEFITGLSVLLKGSLAERVTWIFNLYDINNDGYITREELIDVVTSIYDLMSDQTVPRIDDNTAIKHVDRIFDKLDLNRDGVVTMDEFMEYCSKNEEVVNSMSIFNTLH